MISFKEARIYYCHIGFIRHLEKIKVENALSHKLRFYARLFKQQSNFDKNANTLFSMLCICICITFYLFPRKIKLNFNIYNSGARIAIKIAAGHEFYTTELNLFENAVIYSVAS